MEQNIDNPVLRMDEWLECTGMAPEIAETFGRLYFVCGDTVFTSHRRGTSFCEKACLPAYPLALWIAQCWWRLFYEPKPESSSYTWGTAHCMRSAGYGFLWPDVWLQSDGVFVDIQAHDYKADPKEPLEYFGHELCRIPLERAEVCLSDFVDSVVARVGDTKPEFKELWSEVLKERQSDTLAFMRKIEAALGCDPDDISEEMLQALAGNAQDLGRTNLLEVLASAPRTEAPDTKAATEMLCGVMHSKGVHGRFNLPAMPSDVSLSSPSQPWELGRSMANQLRRQAGIDGKIDNKTFGS